MLYNINSLKIGYKVIQNKEPCIIIGNECIKPGKGQSFNRILLKQIKSGKILEKTLKSGECLESANIIESKLVYLYRYHELWFFMNKKNFDQIAIPTNVIGQSSKWVIEQLDYNITFWNGIPILVTPPRYIQLKIIKTSPIIKNAAVSSGNKLATVSTGAIVKVPFFIQNGELIKINTDLGTYVSRVR